MTVQELYARIGGDYEAAKRVLPTDRMIAKFVLKFLDDNSCGKLFSGWENGDLAGVFDGAHAVKGVCANLGLTGLSGKASELAEEFRPGSARTMTDEEAARRVDELRALYEKTIEAIRAFSAEQE